MNFRFHIDYTVHDGHGPIHSAVTVVETSRSAAIRLVRSRVLNQYGLSCVIHSARTNVDDKHRYRIWNTVNKIEDDISEGLIKPWW